MRVRFAISRAAPAGLGSFCEAIGHRFAELTAKSAALARFASRALPAIAAGGFVFASVVPDDLHANDRVGSMRAAIDGGLIGG